jgi:transposase
MATMATRRGRPTTPLVLSDAEREVLERWARRGSTAQSLALRSRIVLGCAEDKASRAVAQELGTSEQTVCKWRGRFIRSRLPGLADEYRPGAPPTISNEMVEKVVIKTLEETPRDATHWSVRGMAKDVGMASSTIHRIWHAFGLQPHRTETFKLSNDPLFVDKVWDITALYLNPPEAAAVLCVGEKSQIQALDRTQPILPMRPGLPERRTHDYSRHGTTSLFAALDLASGKVIGQTYRQHRAIEFKKFLERIDKEVPADLTVHLILDNYSTHKTPEIKKWLLRHPRFHLHFTPTYSSWMNLIERWFGELSEKWLRRGTHRSTPQLELAIRHWIATWNENPRAFVWTKTAQQILDSLSSYLQRISGTGH